MISQTAEYALRAIVYLGNQGGEPGTTASISKAIKAPTHYLSKVMKSLANAGIVGSQRGLHGGFTLTRPPEKMTILDVVNAVDPIQRIRECPLGNKAHGKNLCPLHRTMDNTMAAAEETFRHVTVDTLLDGKGRRSTKTCRFPFKCETASSSS